MMNKQQLAGLSWTFDLAGAAMFAWGVADAVAALAQNAALSLWPVGALLLGGLIRAGAVRLAHGLAIVGAQTSIAPLRRALFVRLLGRIGPAPSIGRSAVLAIDHMATLENFEARFVPIRLAAALGPLIVLVIVAMASLVAAGILFMTLLPFICGLILTGTLARRASLRQLEALGALSDLFVDRVRALPIIRHFRAEERVARQVSGATREVAERTILVLRAAFLSSAVLEFFSALAIALVAVYCGFSLLGLLPFPNPETLTLREAFFALTMAPEFYLPMRRLAAAYHDKQLGEAAREAIDALPAPPKRADTPAPPFAGLTICDAVIEWPGRRIGPVAFAMGTIGLIAITGPTGSGKTSLLAAIAGQRAPEAGTLTAIDPGDIAWASQHPLILPGSLRDNLTLANPGASAHEIERAIEQTGLAGLVATRAEGLDLLLDHRGSGLSGGERRRLGLARAILSGRALLLCDEPTADLDARSAAIITDLLRDLARQRAIIVATHDERLVALARRVVAL